MMETMEKRAEAREMVNQAGAEVRPAKDEREPLQMLVGELLVENQRLRFRVAQLEQEAQRAERGLAEATKWAGIAF